MFFLANPSAIPFNNFDQPTGPTTETMIVLALISISLFEGLILGLFLAKWSSTTWKTVILGILINFTTLSFFWLTLFSHQTGYTRNLPPTYVVFMGEIGVVAFETMAAMTFLALQTKKPPTDFLVRSFTLILGLNILSFFAGLVATSL
jgi:hypothetical protein